MRRRGFLRALAGAAVAPALAPVAKMLAPAIVLKPTPRALDLAAFDAALKELYRDIEVSTFAYAENPFLVFGLRQQLDRFDKSRGFPVESNSAAHRQTEESADGEGQGSECGESRVERSEEPGTEDRAA